MKDCPFKLDGWEEIAEQQAFGGGKPSFTTESLKDGEARELGSFLAFMSATIPPYLQAGKPQASELPRANAKTVAGANGERSLRILSRPIESCEHSC